MADQTIETKSVPTDNERSGDKVETDTVPGDEVDEVDEDLDKTGDEAEEEKLDVEKCLFSPPLAVQRYQKIYQLVDKFQAKSVLDLGCGECRVISKLKTLPFVERITGVDVDKQPLMMSKHLCRPLTSDHLCPRSRPLTIELYQGDLTKPDRRILGHEVVTMVEVVEHLVDEVLQKLPSSVFGILKPRYCVVTTPNSEYNVTFTNFQGFRHWDHKFEWNREEFQQWATKICSDYNYTVTYDGVGEAPEENPLIGFCTQIAIFKRNHDCDQEQNRTVVLSESYTLMCNEKYPFRTERERTIQKICQEMERIVATQSGEDELVKIRMDNVYNDDIMKKICEDRDELVKVLREVGYDVSEDDGAVLIDRREPWYSEGDSDSGGQFSDASQDESREIPFDKWKNPQHECWD